MANKISGFIGRMVMGSEKSEDYARNSLPSNRWELFWDILKGRFGKLVVINLLVCVFFIPLFLLLFFRGSYYLSYGMSVPFGQGFGVGYMSLIDLTGIAEQIVINVDVLALALLPVAGIVAALGVAGGAYILRNMVWTEGIFVSNDFWRGIKQNAGIMILISVIYCVVFYALNISVALADRMIALGSGITWLLIASKVISYAALAFYTIMTLHMITMVVTYKVSIGKMFKNAFLFTVYLFPQNLFFGVIALAPFTLMFIGGTVTTIGLCVMVFLGFVWALLVWTNYSQWIYDRVLDKKNRGMETNKGIYEKVKGKDEAASLKQYREQMAVRSALSSRPIKPITDEELTLAELPASFNRSDIEKLGESRQALYDDYAKYVEEHKNDPEFAVPEEEKAAEQANEREKRIEKAKRELAKRDRKKRK